jgi:hypothetical protein
MRIAALSTTAMSKARMETNLTTFMRLPVNDAEACGVG